MDVQRLLWNSDLTAAYQLRREVFVDEQHVPFELEYDERDTAPGTYHVVVRLVGEGEAAGTGRVFADDDGHVHIGRIAVRREARKMGIGARVMAELHEIAREIFAGDEGVEIFLSAQLTAIDFYRRLGYQPVSDEIYLDAGIEHQDMSVKLSSM
ncbi:GNAT family N-acetyltransferase [Arcanobacterium phocisimile]|uniref:GNAT family N-acetyltransferase n=1 Tax=Arcanobacterium phocisimile TaxID=1302235 RepID=A0ABX7II59_9ACTO|nr:GNAT family N-acetyltransferase [Arcanobacterium phocisimile]QRV02782.1 GNAT family N-acetyltransferase [Arcanobacterium phocisimile]